VIDYCGLLKKFFFKTRKGTIAFVVVSTIAMFILSTPRLEKCAGLEIAPARSGQKWLNMAYAP